MSPTQGVPGSADEDQPAVPGEAQAPSKKRRRRRGIQVDAYGVKADLRPVETGEPLPRTLREVLDAVQAKVMSIAVNTFGLLDDLIIGLRKYVRGAAAIPPAAQKRVERAHDRADRKEGRRQEKFEAKELHAPDAGHVIEQIEALFAEMRAEGALIEPHNLGDGRTGILIVPPEVRDDALLLARAALPEPSVEGLAGLLLQTILPPRIANILAGAGLRTATDLSSRTAIELLAIDRFGEKSLATVRATLVQLGLGLRGDPAEPAGVGEGKRSLNPATSMSMSFTVKKAVPLGLEAAVEDPPPTI